MLVLIGMLVVFTTVSFGQNQFYSTVENSLNVDHSQLLAYNSTTTYEMLVYASSTLDDLCGQFEDSWLNTGLKWYCRLGGDVFTCTAYRIVSYTCMANDVVRLVLEGDYNSALKKALNTAASTFKVVKNSYGYTFMPAAPQGEYCPYE